MSMSAWIVVGDQPAVGNLVTVARSLGGPVGAVVAGPRPVAEAVAASGVDKVVWCSAPGDVPAEARAAAVAGAVAADPPRVILAGRNPGERVLLGAAAARLGAAVLTGARSVAFDGDAVVVVNAVFGDIAERDRRRLPARWPCCSTAARCRRPAAPARPSRRCPPRRFP